MSVELTHLAAGRHEIAVLAYAPRRSRRVSIVVGHGYSSSKHNLDALCAFLAGHGLAVDSLDFPGHKLGASIGALRSADDLVEAMSAVVDRARHRGDPVYVLGHSMGAQAALMTAAAHPQVAGAIAIATGLGRPAALDALGGRGAVDLRSSYVKGLTLEQLVAQTEPRVRAALPALAGRPCLYIAAERDGMVTRASVEALYDAAPEPKDFVTVASDHTYAGEHSRSAVLAWLGARHPRDAATQVPA